MWYSLASYAALAALGLLAVKYYNPNFFDKFRSAHALASETETRATKKPKKQKIKKSKLNDDNEIVAATSRSDRSDSASKKRKIVSAPSSQSVKATTKQGEEVDLPRDDEGSMSNKEFARQLAQVQAGVKLEKKQTNGKGSRRTVKPSLKSQNGLLESPDLSAETSSTGGRDADDDMSLTETAPLGTSLPADTRQAGDVSDMLEPAAPAPKTLRVTDVKTTEKKKKKQAGAKYEPVLTKKQKQRQKLQEENRRLREESDRLHEAKKQKQLTTARLAEGTSNQLKANAFAAAAPNAWQKKPEAPAAPEQTQNGQQQLLLDTFEAEKGQVKPASTETTVSSSNGQNQQLSNAASWAEQVNEDAQNEWAKTLEEEESWEPVVSKKSKKKNRKDTDTSSEASGALSKHQTPSVRSGSRKGSLSTKPQPHGTLGENRFASMEKLNADSWEA